MPHVICKYSEENFLQFCFHIYFSLIKFQCCGFKEKNQPEKIFNGINFCTNINQSKSLCDEKMKNDLQKNLVTIIVIHSILTGIGALACLMAICLTCTTNNKMQHTSFQSRYRQTSMCAIYIHIEDLSFVTFSSSFRHYSIYYKQ